MALETKEFHLGDVLSVVTGYNISPRDLAGINDLVNFMLGEPMVGGKRFESSDMFRSEVIALMAEACKPHILEQFPQFKAEFDIAALENNPESWLESQMGRYGKNFLIKTLPDEIKDKEAGVIFERITEITAERKTN